MRNIVLGFVLVALVGFGFQEQATLSPVNSLEGIKEFTETPTKAVKNKPPAPLTRVIRVVDGDTIVIEENGVQEKVRLIGVNTPESVDPRRTVECFGKEASNFTTMLLLDKNVRIESDPSQGNRDKYGRLLRFVFLSDGTLANRTILAEGYGYEYTYKTPYRYQDDFKSAEKNARRGQKGLWAEDACLTIR
ncbi:MAG: thermonuclease family protein [Patescibacteria group bacterium]